MEDVNTRRRMFFLNLGAVSRTHAQEIPPTFDISSKLKLSRRRLKKREFILIVTFLLLLPSSLLKLANVKVYTAFRKNGF